MLLPGHGTRVGDLARTNWSQWVAATGAALAEMQRQCRKVAVVGYSLGGTLALYAAATAPRPPQCLVTLAAAVELADRRAPLARWVSPLVRYLPAARVDGSVAGYDTLPVRSVAETLALTAATRRQLPGLDTPLLVVQGERDDVVHPRSAAIIRELVPRAQVRLLPGAGHSLLAGEVAEQVRRLTTEFITGSLGMAPC